MIGSVRGTLADVEGNLALIDVGGVGYEVSVPDLILLQLPKAGESVSLLTRQIVREDGVFLYGFLEAGQRRLFDQLLTVNKCGPKAAMALLGQLGETAVAAAILASDVHALTRASGVGAKLAERIILELKTKVHEDDLIRRATVRDGSPAPRDASDELVDALLALGYRRSEAEGAAHEARQEADAVPEQLKAALRLLKK